MNSFKELCIVRATAENAFAWMARHVYIYIYIVCVNKFSLFFLPFNICKYLNILMLMLILGKRWLD